MWSSLPKLNIQLFQWFQSFFDDRGNDHDLLKVDNLLVTSSGSWCGIGENSLWSANKLHAGEFDLLTVEAISQASFLFQSILFKIVL